MYRLRRLFRLAIIGLTALALLQSYLATAEPTSILWGSFDQNGSTAYGVYENDGTTILQTGDLAQLIWAGPDGLIDPPAPDGSTTGDDQILEPTSTIQNDGTLPVPAWDRGYIPFTTYSFDTTDAKNNGTIYIRAWNASTANSATAYGDSVTGTLSAGGTFNALRWRMTHTPSVVTLSTFRATSSATGWPSGNRLGLFVAAGIGLLVAFGASLIIEREYVLTDAGSRTFLDF